MIKIKFRKMAFCLLQIFLMATLLQSSMGFNLDIPTYVKHNGNRGSMFGFSVALYKSGGNNSPYASKWVIVGAPKDNNTQYQPSIIQPGAVWRCDIEGDDRCRVVAFDSQPNQVNDRYEQIDSKSNQWLGATIAASSDDNGIIVACAPRYVFHGMNPSIRETIEPVGTCFTSRNFSTFTEYSPCRTNYFGYHRQGYCQAGLSAGVSKKGDRLFIGAPGSWYWQGQAFSIDADSKYPYKPPIYQDFGYGGQSYSYDIMHPKSRVYSTTQGGGKDDDSYLGYSTATGDFDGDGEEDVALGIPRGAGLLGKIAIYKWHMHNIINITGWQIGAYFGYSLATCDVDGDGYDDLIIGAPMYSEPNNEGKYDVGRVYIMMQGKNPMEKFTREEFRDGTNSKGRFGLALTNLGDINRDDFGDFAVGAPYDGPNGRGAVYVFHGSSKGPLPKPSQVIFAEDIIGAVPPRTFGFSLSGGVDLDGNLYPDLAVGAYASDQVLVFRSRPVAMVDASTSFMKASKLIDLEEKSCKTRDGNDVPCTNVNSCWRYNGINLPEILEFQVSLVLDARKTKSPRMFFIRTEGRNIRNSTIRLQRGKTFCQNETVYLMDNIRDKLTPLEVELRYQLRNSLDDRRSERIKREYLEPVIDQNREIIQRDTMNIQKNCGMDNICVPDLRLEIKTVNKYLLGSKQPLEVEVLVSNFGEDAFEAGFYMTMPEELDFKRISIIGDNRGVLIACAAPSQATNYTLKCDIGNPLPTGKVANFKVIMIPSALKVGMASSYDFFMEANSTNPEKEGSGFDNIIRKSIGMWVETKLAIEGATVPQFGHYDASEYTAIENATKESDLGPDVVYIFNIRNNGASRIEEAVVNIHYPYQTLGDDVLMYLLNQPETDGNIVCEPHINVNPLNLQIDQKLARKSYLVSIGAVIRNSSSSFSHIEHSSGGSSSSSSSVSSSISGTKILSEEEKRRLDEEAKHEASGDASFVHEQRAKEAAAAAAIAQGHMTGGGSGGSSWTTSSSWNSSSRNDGSQGPSVVVSSRNRTVTYDSAGRPHVVETSTEYNLNRQGSSAQQYSQQRAGNRQWSSSDEDARPHIEYNTNVASFGGGPSRAASEQRAYQQQASQQQSRQQNGQRKQYDPNSVRQFGQQSELQAGQQSGKQYSNTYSPAQMSYNRQAAAGRGFDDLQGTTLDKFGGGQGFRTGTLDLGTLNRGNVDNELRQRAGSATSYAAGGGGSGANGQQGRTFNTYSRSSASDPVYSQRISSHREKPYYGTADSEYYYDQYDNNDRGEYFSSSSSSSSSGRTKREADDGTITLSSIAPCTTTKCATIRCVAKNLGNNDGAWVALRTRLVADTMERLAADKPLNVSVTAVSKVTKLPYIGAPAEEIVRSHEISFKAIPKPKPTPNIIPLWIVILAACVGATILLLLVYLLHKCGFFHRNRPSGNSQERQPLRNGYHGDEHL